MFARFFPDLVPEKMGPDADSLRPFQLDKAAEIWAMDRPSKWAEHKGQFYARRLAPGIELDIHWSFEDRPHFNGIEVRLDDRLTRDLTRLDAIVAFVQQSCSTLRPVYAWASHNLDFRGKSLIKRYDADRRTWVESPVPGPPRVLSAIYWLNYFGPPFVELFGRQKLIQAPVYAARPVGPGVLILTSPSPLDYGKGGVRGAEETLKDYLGREAFFDTKRPGGPYRTPTFDFAAVSSSAWTSRLED